MSAVEIVTLGCRVNAFESEVMRERLAAAGLDGGRPTVVVNTCAVTAEAERQARQAIRRLRRERPAARIVVTGCAAQANPGAFAAMAEVDRVVGNLEKLDPAILAGGTQRVAVSDVMAPGTPAAPAVAGFEGRARAFVQVQQGCDHRCTFCIVPFTRGPSRSLPPEAVVAQARALVAAGYAELVLTGIDAASYGRDLPDGPSLGGLAARVLAEVPEMKRLRLTTLDPAVRDEALFALLADEPRLMPHLHLSLQAFDDLTLKRMKRRHTGADAAAFVARARAARPDVALGADLIAGFPTETAAMFDNTLAAVAGLGLVFLHVFPYSPRPGTPAARMPMVPAAVRKERARRLREAGAEALAGWLAGRVGTTVEALAEEPGLGRSEHYAPVRLPPSLAPGAVARLRIAAATGEALVAEAA